jgi:hypothetical protein
VQQERITRQSKLRARRGLALFIAALIALAAAGFALDVTAIRIIPDVSVGRPAVWNAPSQVSS